MANGTRVRARTKKFFMDAKQLIRAVADLIPGAARNKEYLLIHLTEVEGLASSISHNVRRLRRIGRAPARRPSIDRVSSIIEAIELDLCVELPLHIAEVRKTLRQLRREGKRRD